MRRRDVHPWLEKLVHGKVVKEIAYEEGLQPRVVSLHLQRYVENCGYCTLMEAVADYSRYLYPTKPPDAVD